MIIASFERCRKLVENTLALQIPSNDEVIACPCMITTSTVGVQCPRKLRFCGKDHTIPHALRFHFSQKTTARLINHLNLPSKAILHVVVHAPSADGEEEEI